MVDDEMHAVFAAFVVHAGKRTPSTPQSTIVRCATRGVPRNEFIREIGLIHWDSSERRRNLREDREEEAVGNAEAGSAGVKSLGAAFARRGVVRKDFLSRQATSCALLLIGLAFLSRGR
jgi:hypothetical protein